MGAHHSIGLLALISGQGLDLENFSLAKAGPLLILMGFVATTLSICDPFGALTEVGSCRVPILPTSHVPNLTFFAPNLTGALNVHKIEQCRNYHHPL